MTGLMSLNDPDMFFPFPLRIKHILMLSILQKCKIFNNVAKCLKPKVRGLP